MANALLALVSNSRNVNPYFAICQKTISGATSRWSFFLPFWAVYSRGVRGGGRLFAQLTTCREDLSNKPFSRDCWGSSYCPLGNTGSWSPYFAFAQYGLWLRLCARAVALARIRLRWPRLCARAVALARIRLRQLVYCPLGNTPSQCRLGTPRRAAIELKSLNYRHFI